MKNSEHRMTFHIGTGMAPLLLLFCVCCMVAFAVLCYVQTRMQLNLSDKAVQRVAEVYEAQSHALKEGRP